MKNYLKKFSIMFVMALAMIGVGIIQNGTMANAEEIDSNTKVLLHMNDNTFKDELGHNVTNYDTTLDTTNKKFGNGSAYFNGSSSYITYPDSSDWDFGSNDFTIEFWMMTPTTPTTQQIILDSRSALVTKRWAFNTTTSGKLEFSSSTNGLTWTNDIVSSVTLNGDTWNHISVVRYGSILTMYINGTNVGMSSIYGSISTDTGLLTIGCGANLSSYYFKGYIDEVRISKGIARWTSDFTPPTAPYNELLISLDNPTMNLTIGDSKQLTATTTPASAEVTWTSSDPSIATVDSTGKVIGVKEGQATITVQIKGSETKATCVVTVTKSGNTEPTTGDANLFIELVDGNIKSYNVSSTEITKFKQWYLDRDNTTSNKPYYEFSKGDYKDYVIHDKIDWFEVR